MFFLYLLVAQNADSSLVVDESPQARWGVMDDEDFLVGCVIAAGALFGPVASYSLAWAIVNNWQSVVLVGQGVLTLVGGASFYWWSKYRPKRGG